MRNERRATERPRQGKTTIRKKKGRLTIAFLTRSFSTDLISYSIWSGVFDAARAAGVDLICLPGNPPRSRLGFEYQANALFDMVDRNTMDGLLVWGGAMVGVSSPEDTLVFYRRFDGFPMVNISLELADIPCLIIDNYSGMFEACAHLIEAHGCRRLAFLRGPEDHPESRERYRAYTDALRRFGIASDPALVVVGTFLRQSGRRGIASLLDERKLAFDAVTAANDLMALGAADELLERGIRIPDEVKVAGFDDIEESQYYRVPLTTVRQPFYEMGRTAVANLLCLIRDEPFAARLVLPTSLMTRQSCGCPHAAAVHDSVGPVPAAEETGPTDRDSFARRLSVSLARESGIPEESAQRLAGSFHDHLWSRREGEFLTVLDRELLGRRSLGDLKRFHPALSALRRGILPSLRSEPSRLGEAESLMQRARLLVGEYIEKAQAYEAFRQTALNEALRRINRIMISTYNFDDFTAIIAREFPQFDIPSYYFCIYDDPAVSLERSRLLLACADRKKVSLPPGGILFPTKAIVPEGLLPAGRQLTIIVEPLYFHGEQLGYMVFEDDHKAGILYEELRSHLSVALKGTLLFREKERLLAEREEQARHLLQTSAGLARSNAELEQFTSIVSHDLKEPLRKIAVFADRLQSLPSLAGNKQAQEYCSRVTGSIRRMHALIDDLLAYSRLSKNSGPFVKVNLNDRVRAVLQDLEILVEQEKASIEVGALPVIEAEPRHIEQLLQNLITNALKFHQPGRPVRITVSGRRHARDGREYCELTVRDNGIGIEAKHFEDIFGLFQRLHGKNEFEGTGIGLAICKKVAEEHHGSIRVESEKGMGSAFIVTLPLRH